MLTDVIFVLLIVGFLGAGPFPQNSIMLLRAFQLQRVPLWPPRCHAGGRVEGGMLRCTSSPLNRFDCPTMSNQASVPFKGGRGGLSLWSSTGAELTYIRCW